MGSFFFANTNEEEYQLTVSIKVFSSHLLRIYWYEDEIIHEKTDEWYIKWQQVTTSGARNDS